MRGIGAAVNQVFSIPVFCHKPISRLYLMPNKEQYQESNQNWVICEDLVLQKERSQLLEPG